MHFQAPLRHRRAPQPGPRPADPDNPGAQTMNRKYATAIAAAIAIAGTAIALVPALASASAPSATPGAASKSLGTTNFLTLAAARTASDEAIRSCKAKGYPVSVTVVDRDGIVIAQERANGATGATVQVSLGKAVAAAGFQS